MMKNWMYVGNFIEKINECERRYFERKIEGKWWNMDYGKWVKNYY
jgi:hypothetical protein